MARYALVVGISNYQTPLSPLSKTATDAQAVAQILKDSGQFQEVTLLAGSVTGSELGQALQRLLLQQASKNEALVYFTGHGITARDHLGQLSGLLATTDSQIEQQDHQVIEVSHGIALDKLNELIHNSDLSNLVMLLDCCHGEFFLERGLVERLTAFSASKDYYFISSCRSFEEARAKRSERHSVFTGALLKAIRRENVDELGVVSGDRLFDCLARELKGSGQEPIRMGWGRSIPIVQYPIEAAAPAPQSVFRRENPYVGLVAFSMAQADYFYGREGAVRDLLDRLTKGQFLVVYGPSGCGKSSLIKAGLLPQLQADRLPGSGQWHLELCTPGQRPLQTLLEILDRQHHLNQPFVLFVDQFEELFTLCQDGAEQQQFIHLLSEEVNNPHARILIAIRGDFLERCTQFPEVVKLINSTDPPSTYLVTPLTLAEIEAAIEQPAARHGVRYEAGLVSEIAEDVVGEPGELPLLQYALTELWKACIDEDSELLLTQQKYAEIGGVQGALQRRADLLYGSFSAADRRFVHQLMMQLVHLREGMTVTRRQATWQEIELIADSPEQMGRVVRQLADQRLIVTDAKTVEIAHEALVTQWSLVKELVEENREAIRLRRQLENDCQEWQEQGRSEDYLLSPGRLAAIEEWMKRDQPRLSALATEYISQSQNKRDREQQSELDRERELREGAERQAHLERQRKRMAVRFWMIVAAFLVAIFIVFFTWSEAKNNLFLAIEGKVSPAESKFRDHQQLEALVESLKALDFMKKKRSDETSYLKRLQTIIYGVQERDRWNAHDSRVYALSFNHSLSDFSRILPTDVAIASGSYDGEIKLWNIKGELLKSLPKQEGAVWSLKFSHNGKLLASTGFEGKVKVWNLSTGKKISGSFPDHGSNGSYGVTFNADDCIIASSGSDGKVKFGITDPASCRKLSLPESLSANKPNAEIMDVDFHPKENKIVYSGGKDTDVWIWNIDSPKQRPQKIGHHDTGVGQVKFNPKGDKVATADGRGIIKIWSAQPSPQPLAIIKAHEQPINGLAFSKDGKTLVSASSDQTIKIWDVSQVDHQISPVLKATLRGHTADAIRADFIFFRISDSIGSEDNKFVISSSSDKTIRLWEWQPISETIHPTKTPELLKYGCQLIQQYMHDSSLKHEVDTSCQ